MSSEEKNTWGFGAVAVIGYATYLTILLGRLSGTTLEDVAYAGPLLATTLGAIGANIALSIVIPRDRGGKDQRDREISRFGDYVGQGFVVLGGVGALVLALLEADYFWIANTVYLAFVLSAILSSVAKIVGYRRGFQTW